MSPLFSSSSSSLGPFPPSPPSQDNRRSFLSSIFWWHLIHATPARLCQPDCWSPFFTSFLSPFFWGGHMLYLLPLPPLCAVDLRDQSSKTDSLFFTDHVCASGYTTADKRERGRERENTIICLSSCVTPKEYKLIYKHV